MAAPKEIIDLVERFENNKESYKSGHYNETQVRREFVDPFFKALGWDVDNEQGFAEAYKDVIHEDAIKVGGTTRAPDYSFRIGGQRKFFLETKKPSVDIKDDIHPAFQLRRYAWTAKLPLSVLTDFEELSVYDCSVKPDQTDKPSKGRIFYLTYQDYLTKWDEIASVFSKNAILKGSFDRFAADKKGKRGTAEVDAAFLEEIAGWREILARNIALRNPDLSTKDLNYAVQAIVNRLVFLRICEDRGIERLMKLQDLLNGERVYPRLCEFFRQADERYNSGIFNFEKEPGRESPDTLTLSLQIDDKPLKDIIKRLYYPDSPYEFSVLPAEILGQVYEQFLGKVIRLTEGHRAVVEDKPEVKKAGGVKYTPVYIVDAIVKKTLGPTLEGKTPLAMVLISVLDPACGSGSFLIVAYQYLLDWHREWYLKNLVPLLESGMKPSSPEVRRMLPGANNEPGKKGRKKEPELPIFQGRGGEWRLTTAERKRILLNNIYGVDIDRQAVEVTKLSLLLKVLEGENDETISKQLKLFQERALPDLGNNIKCGNSLIGWDILEGNPSLTQEEIERINPFDWDKEFSEIFLRGGFDVVIGNPPYGASLEEITRDYFKDKFIFQNYQLDSYLLFLEQSIRYLLHKDGFYGMIIPNPWLTNLLQKNMRIFVAENTRILEIVHFKFAVFQGVTVDTEIVLLQKGDPTGWMSTVIVAETIESFKSVIFGPNLRKIEHSQEKWRKLNGDVINIFLDDKSESIANKCQAQSELLDKIYKINVGIKPYQKGKGIPQQTKEIVENRPFDSSTKIDDTYRLYLRGRDIGRYHIAPIEPRYLKYGSWLAEPRPAANFDAPKKILMRQTGDSLIATIDQQQYLCLNNMHVLVPKTLLPDIAYILGILNSRLLNWYYQTRNPEVGEALAEVKKSNVAALPIHTIDFSKPQDATYHDSMVILVDRMLSLNKQLHEARTPQDQTRLQRQIEATDRQIDALVYELYGLTEEEIKIVEGTCRQI